MSKIKNETIFMMLSGFAGAIVESDDKSLDGVPYKISKSIVKYFNKPKQRYSKDLVFKIVDNLKKFDSELENKSTAPVILLIGAMDYLLNEIEHIETRVAFGHFKSDIKKLFDSVERSEYRKVFYDHLRLLEDFRC